MGGGNRRLVLKTWHVYEQTFITGDGLNLFGMRMFVCFFFFIEVYVHE